MPKPPVPWKAVIRRLGPRQRAVLDQCGGNNTWGHPKQIMAALVRKGLLVEEVTRHRDARGPYEVRQWYMPLDVHGVWCQMCRSASAEDLDDGEQAW